MSFRFANGDGPRGNNSDTMSALLQQALASRSGTMEPPPQRGVVRALSNRSMGGDDTAVNTASLSSLAALNGNALDGLSDAQRETLLRSLTGAQPAPAPTPTTNTTTNTAAAALGRLLAAQAQGGPGAGSLLGAAPPAPQPQAPNNNSATLEALLRLRASQEAAVAPPAPQAPAAGAPNSNATLEALLRLRAQQANSLQGTASAPTTQAPALGGAAAAQAGLFCRPVTAAAAPPPAASNDQASLELELLRLKAGLLQGTAPNTAAAPTTTNDLLEQALKLRASQQQQQQQNVNQAATTAAGRRLSMLMQASSGSGRALGSGRVAMGSGRVSGSGRVATAHMEATSTAALLARLERTPSARAAAAPASATANPAMSQDLSQLVMSQDLAQLVRGISRSQSASQPVGAAQQPTQLPPTQPKVADDQAQKLAFLESLNKPNKTTKLPPVEEGNTPHYSQRVVVPLGIEEDPNWLSERQCFIRSELLEVVRASHEEVLVRSSSKSIAYQQVGIRCRYCAHLQPGSRAIRASAFPSSIRQMYQSFTMMVRDHFGNCAGVPQEKKQRFLKLKGLTSPSSSLSRQYWTFAAKKLGMVDSEYGIMINEESQAAAARIPPFGTSPEETAAIKASKVELLVEESDRPCISTYLFFLMQQAQIVHLLPSERVGKRKDAAVGLPGFGCRHCAEAGRLGFCRMFPLNKRSLPDKVNDLYNHMVRCPQCPRMTKRLLESRQHETENNRSFAERDRDFIDRIWIKLGRDCDAAFKKS